MPLKDAVARFVKTADGDPVPGWVPSTVLVTLFVTLAAWSWAQWADPIVDFGNEPYLSWQILQGRVLYRDLVSLYGPVSPWLNALWFALFGVSLETLAVCNLFLAACLAIVVYRFCAACSDRLTATVATAVLLVSFVFAHHSEDAANYNFVWPYTHAATHGVALLLCGVVVLSRAVVTDRARTWAVAGLLLAATGLIKAEIAVAAAVTAGVAVLWRATDGRAHPLRGPLVLCAACVVPAAVCWLLLGTEAVRAPWAAVAGMVAGEHVFNAHLMGIDDLRGNACRLAVDTALWGVVTAVLVTADVSTAGESDTRRRRLAIAAVAGVGALALRDLPGIGRPLALLVPLAGGALMWIARRRPVDRDRLVPLVLWAAASWALLGRMFFDVHFHHYGFYLAMPAAVLVVVLGVGTVPRLLATRVPGGGRLVRSTALATVGLLLAYSLALSAASYRHMTVRVGSAADALLGPSPDVSPSGVLAVSLREHIAADVPSGAGLAILPQGMLLNFLTRRPNPTIYHDLMPPVFAIYGIDRVIASYDAHPPEFVVLLEWPGDEYGVGTFGTPRWGAELVSWVERHYDRIDVVPSSPTAIGFCVWRHRI